jgi:hypothetical protein
MCQGKENREAPATPLTKKIERQNEPGEVPALL